MSDLVQFVKNAPSKALYLIGMDWFFEPGDCIGWQLRAGVEPLSDPTKSEQLWRETRLTPGLPSGGHKDDYIYKGFRLQIYGLELVALIRLFADGDKDVSVLFIFRHNGLEVNSAYEPAQTYYLA